MVSSASAQNVKHTQNNMDSAKRSDFTVDPTTLGLGFELTIGNYPGRAGTSLPVTLSYSSKLWRMNAKDTYGSPYSAIGKTRAEAKYAEYSASGWTTNLDLPRLEGLEWMPYDYTGAGICILPSCVQENSESATFYVYRMMVHMPDGSGHELRRDDIPFTTHTSGGVYYAVDGSKIRYDAGADVLYLADGSRYLNTGYIGNGVQYIDRNGNTLSYNLSSKQWTDTLGRVISRPPLDTSLTGPIEYKVKGVGDVELPYKLHWSLLADVRTDATQPLRYSGDRTMDLPLQPKLSPALFDSTSGETAVTASAQVFNPIVLHKIELPDGRTYTFTYNVWGEIDKVVYPTGAYERYRYDMIQGISASLSENDVYRHANRGVVERWISETGDGTDEAQHHWQYSAGKSSEAMPYTVVITAPDGSRTERLLLGPQGDTRFGFEHVLSGRAYEERVFSSSGQMLRRVLTEWTNSGPLAGGEWSATRDARVSKQVEILLDTTGQALSATTTFGYDVDMNVIQTKRYGYVSVDNALAQTQAIGSFSLGTLLRTEETTFLVNDPNIGATTRDAYRARNLLSLPTSTRVKDGAGNIVAQSAINYDEAAYPPLTYPSVTSWTDPQTSVRGLATTTSSWLNTTNTWLSAHAQYDQCGNLRKTWDAKGNLSQVEYSATYQYAYPTHTISADPDGAGPLTALTSDTVYDPTSGAAISQTDANNQTTTIEFAATDALSNPNPLRRMTKVNLPDGGWTAYAYGDQPGNLFVMTRTALDATHYTEARQYTDRMGREIWSEMSEGSSSIVAQKQYDQLGRLWKVSNPYRSGETVVWTTTAYDGLGRVLTMTTPDGAQVVTTYNGNQVTGQDQAGKKRSSTTDALGRLTQVIEDPAGLAYQTTYTYDVLGNLRAVQQGTQLARYFMYDSLSRLIRAKNLEQDTNSSLALSDPITGNNQWSLGYSYDANGNLLTKTDARGVTATYSYDALNRNTIISYSDSTPTVTRIYDGAINGKGRLWAGYSGFVSHTAIDNYDAMGRPLTQRQHFYANGSWGTAYATQRTYNLAGGVSSQTYPSGKTVSYTYDQAGRTSAFTGNLGDGVTRTYAGSISYDQWNGLAREQFGTDTPLYHKERRNIRGQLFDTRLSSVNDTWDWNRGRLISYYSSNHLWGQSGTDNNGNVLSSENWIPPANATLDQAESLTEDKYSYDSLNRLSAINEYRMSAAGGWTWAQQFAQSYSYDRYGNRTINAAQTWGTGINSQQFTVDTNNNRLGVPTGMSGAMSYDSAGNLINDSYSGAGARTYDAENRMVTATNNANQQSIYTYDADGRRVRRNSFSQETWQVYGMEGELLAEYAANAAPTSPQKEYGYRNGQLLVTAAAPPRTNVAASANGASASASSTNVYNGNLFPASKAIDGDRRGLNYVTGGVWQSSTTSVPQWLEVDFQGSKTIDEIDLFTLQDSYASPSEPTENLTFSWYGLTAFDVQYWDGSSWVNVPSGSVTGNHNVWRKFTFTAITTTKIRVLANASPDGWSRVAEVEAWGLAAPPRTNVALPTNGGSASASTELTYNGNPFPASKAIDGDRRGLNYNTGGVWQSSSTSLPQWLQVDFPASKTIDEIDLFTLQDSYANPSEPTEIMQFAWYGPTSFEVQYWNGTSWVTVSGGSVTGNYNVWRKFSFSPITTSKIRVLISASADGWSRVAEIEAWQSSGGSNSSADISWLVADQLGTPRMIADRTGSLAGVSRHDYLPFGEELQAGTGGRATAQGYVADDVRQQFTQKERDIETGLDYFGARYYASVQGRFTSVDPLMASGNTVDPQTWNRYSYSYNNPLRFTDPSGMLAGDFLENETGKYLGTDGQADGKYYVVTDKKEVKQIAATNKSGGTTSLASVTSAIEVTAGGYDVRQAIGAAVVRSDSPSGSDTKGGFHEEAVTWGPDGNGVERAIPAAPGPYSDPLVNAHAQVTPSNFANKKDEGVLQDVHGIAHIHPSGVSTNITSQKNTSIGITMGGDIESTGKFVQTPASRDIGNALPNLTNIVVGARNNTVYFYRNSGNRTDCNCAARLPLKVFLGLK